MQYSFSHVAFRLSGYGVAKSSLQHWKKSADNQVQVLAIAGDIARQIHVQHYVTIATPVMMSKCANPQCSRTLMRMEGGRFFGFPAKNKAIENFWLCGSCAIHYTLRQIEGRVELLPRERKTA